MCIHGPILSHCNPVRPGPSPSSVCKFYHPIYIKTRFHILFWMITWFYIWFLWNFQPKSPDLTPERPGDGISSSVNDRLAGVWFGLGSGVMGLNLNPNKMFRFKMFSSCSKNVQCKKYIIWPLSNTKINKNIQFIYKLLFTVVKLSCCHCWN